MGTSEVHALTQLWYLLSLKDKIYTSHILETILFTTLLMVFSVHNTNYELKH
jgi:hypothetical protein